MLAGYYQKNKERLRKEAYEGIKIFPKKKKTKSEKKRLLKDIKIFLKKKKKKCVRIVVNVIKIFLKRKNKG